MATDRFSTTPVSTIHIRNLPHRAISDVGQIAEPAVYQVDLANTKISAAFYPKVQSDALYVFFSGFINRTTLSLPVFRRWGWHGQFPGHALYISDPTLEACSDLGLGWYIGDQGHDCMDDIEHLVRGVARTFGVEERRVVFYGSSGGGFATLRALRWFPQAAAITINPQTRLTAFRGQSLTNYLARFFGGISKPDFAQTYPARNALVSALDGCRDASVVYVQNRLDAHHVTDHLGEFFAEEDGALTSTFLQNHHLILFEDPQGHDSAEPIALVPRLIAAAGALQASRFG